MLAASFVVAPAAHAGITGPAKVRPGEQVTYTATGFAPSNPIAVTLEPALGTVDIGTAFASGGDGAAAITFIWPQTYRTCTEARGCVDHPFLPGERVDVAFTQLGEPVASAEQGTSSASAQGIGVRVDPRARLAEAKLLRKRLRGRHLGHVRWSRWGAARAIGRGRGARVVASRLKDCGGTAYYARVKLRREGRTVRLARLAPC